MKDLPFAKNVHRDDGGDEERKNKIESNSEKKKRKRSIIDTMGESSTPTTVLCDEQEQRFLEDILSDVNDNNINNGVSTYNDQTNSIVDQPAAADHQEGDGVDNSAIDAKPIGLKLTRTQSLVDLLNMKLSSKIERPVVNNSSSPPKNNNNNNNNNNIIINNNNNNNVNKPKSSKTDAASEKLKASNIPALVLDIGGWTWVARNLGGLVAKFYYAKQRIVWEMLDGALKSKIEIQWSDITAIRAILSANEPGILDIELKQPPTFFRESNPQPRRHTNWHQASDFTRGRALVCRRHSVKFAAGVLDKHYRKLLQHDGRLKFLSQKPFPSLADTGFQQTNVYGTSNLSFNPNGYGSSSHPGLHYSTYPTNTIRGAPFRSPPNSSFSGISVSSFNNQNGSNYQLLGQQQQQNGSNQNGSNHQLLGQQQQQIVNWNPEVNLSAALDLDFPGGQSYVTNSINQSHTSFSSQDQVQDEDDLFGNFENSLVEGPQVQQTYPLQFNQNSNDAIYYQGTNYGVNNGNGDQMINSSISNPGPIGWCTTNMQAMAGTNSSNGGYFPNLDTNGYNVHGGQRMNNNLNGQYDHDHPRTNPNNNGHYFPPPPDHPNT